MGLISKTIRSLINGVSQQAPSVRLDNQLEAQENMIPDLAIGLTRRNPVALDNVIAQDGSRTYSDEHAMFTYTVNEEIVTIGIKPDGTVYRFDENFEGTLVQQSTEVTTYLTHTDPSEISAVETEDRLIILNKGIKVELDFTGYTNKYAPKDAATSEYDVAQYLHTDFSSTMDAFFGVAVDAPATTYGNFSETYPLTDKLVIWNSDHTRFGVYNQSPTKASHHQSPENALIKKALFVLDTGHSGFDTPSSAYTIDPVMPTNVIATISFERSAEDVRIPPIFKDTGSTRWTVEVNQGIGAGAESTLDIQIGDFTDTGVALDGGTYGYWNDTDADSLDLTSFTYTHESQVYSVHPDLIRESSTVRDYGLRVDLDKNEPSFISGLPVKVELTDRSASDFPSGWAVTPEGVSANNTEEYIYDSDGVGPQYYVKVNGLVSSPITSIEVESLSGGTMIISAVTNADQFPVSTRADLGTFTPYYNDNERLLMGWCVDKSVGDDEAWYSIIHQKYTPTTGGVISIDTGQTETAGMLEFSYDSTQEASEKKHQYSGFLTVDDYSRRDFKFSIPLLGNKSANFYDYNFKNVRTATASRHLIWLTTVVDGATYNVVAYDSAGTPTTLCNRLGDGKSPTSMAVLIAAETRTKSGFTAESRNNTLTVIGDDIDYIEVKCDYGAYIDVVAEARPNGTEAIPSPDILPSNIPEGYTDTLGGTEEFLVRVNPSGTIQGDNNYYLRWTPRLKAWVEVADEYMYTINKTTMPVSIIKTTPDSIIIDHTKISIPKAGDNVSNLEPSFIDKKLKDIILFNSRLGFAIDSNLVFSQIGELFNFYRTTTSSVLISDVVDVELDSSKLGYKPIENIFTLDNSLIVNTSLTQSVLRLPTNLDISKAILTKISSFDLGTATPIAVRRSMYFPIQQGTFSTVKEFKSDTDSNYTDNSTTRHCEKYIAGKVLQSVFTNDVTLMRTDDNAKVLYVQHSYVQEGTVIQNAWHKWSFAYDIKYIYASGEDIKIVFEDTTNTQTIYGTLSLVPSDVIGDTTSQIGYTPYLDFNTEDVTLAALITGYITVDKALGKLVTLGDANSVNGITYSSKFTLSEVVPRKQEEQGKTKLGYVRLMIRRMSLSLGLSGRLTITVERTNRDDYTHNYVPSVIGTIVIGREEVTNESARFPVNGRSKDIEVTVDTVDTFTPFQALSVEWQGQLITKGGR